MLSELKEFSSIFCTHQTHSCKDIDYIRVDGSVDEGPSHEVVQYWWIEWHINNKKVSTLLTSRSSSSSYLNHVELQNGCIRWFMHGCRNW